MSVGTPVQADIPGLYDVIINGHGYCFDRALEQSLPFRTQRARYGHSPTFLDRTNVSGDYGDDKQSFWQTATQRDWSLGEDQQYFRSTDPDSIRRCWLTNSVDVSKPGQVKLQQSRTSLTFAANPTAIGGGSFGSFVNNVYVSTSTNLYQVDNTGTITSLGAHGCGAAPTSIVTDGVNAYLSGDTTTAIRKWDGASFTTFSATANVSSLAFLNNSLYGISGSTLYRFSTAGVATTLNAFKGADGSTAGPGNLIFPFGGQLAILQNFATPEGNILWVYNGTGVEVAAQFPRAFAGDSMEVVSGILFIGGREFKKGAGGRAAIYYVTSSGSMGRAYAGSYGSATHVYLSSFQQGLLFHDFGTTLEGSGRTMIRYYDLAQGGVSTVGTGVTGSGFIAAADQYFVVADGSSTAGFFCYPTTVASTGTVYTSVFDFESSLTKLFRGVILKFGNVTTGDTGWTVDVHYRLEDTEGSYTLLQSGVTSGTEVLFPANTTGSGVTLKIVLNKGSSTTGPKLIRTYVRAVPVLQSYRQTEYVLDLSGRLGKTPVILNDGETSHPLTGFQQATNLNTDIQAQNPVTVIDRFGSFTGIIQPDQSDIIEVRPEEYVCRVLVRQV